MWTALEFVRSRRTSFRWYVLATNGRRRALIGIELFQRLVAKGIANRGPREPFIEDATFERLKQERLSRDEVRERLRMLELQHDRNPWDDHGVFRVG